MCKNRAKIEAVKKSFWKRLSGFVGTLIFQKLILRKLILGKLLSRSKKWRVLLFVAPTLLRLLSHFRHTRVQNRDRAPSVFGRLLDVMLRMLSVLFGVSSRSRPKNAAVRTIDAGGS